MNELDKQYSPSYWSKRFSSPAEVIRHHLKFIQEASLRVRSSIPNQLNTPYGATERQKFDIFGTDLPNDAPILIYIHGGYWQNKEIHRSSYHFIAKHLHKNNIKSIFVGYDLCPDVTITEIEKQIEKATVECLRYAEEKKSKGVYFMGHSAGAHLVASLFADFIKSPPGVDQSMIKGAILASGVFDLLPLQKTVINEAIGMDEEVALQSSPLKRDLVGGKGIEVYTIVGENESVEFIKQSREFYEKLSNSGFQSQLAIVKGVDHFDIIERLADEEYAITYVIIKKINKE